MARSQEACLRCNRSIPDGHWGRFQVELTDSAESSGVRFAGGLCPSCWDECLDWLHIPASRCPGCDADLGETWEDGGCTRCGFYFDGDHIRKDRLEELNRIAAEYNDKTAMADGGVDGAIERHLDRREPTGAGCFGPEDVAVLEGDLPPPGYLNSERPGEIGRTGVDPDRGAE